LESSIHRKKKPLAETIQEEKRGGEEEEEEEEEEKSQHVKVVDRDIQDWRFQCLGWQ
jgi:hypothetical protein